MLRIVLGVIAGFFSWVIALIGGEMVVSALLPEAFGQHQRAFQEVLENGGAFTANMAHLMMHVVLASITSVFSGFLAALIAGENKHAPLVLACLLFVLGLLKMMMSWSYMPLWYHVIFTAILLPMTMLGGKLKTSAKEKVG